MTDLDELRKLAEKATPGPWVVQQPGENDPGAGTTYIDTHAYEDGPYPVVAPSYPIAEADATYIAALVNWHLAAISSSSAPETQRTFAFRRADGTMHYGDCTYPDGPCGCYESSSATETQDGERPTLDNLPPATCYRTHTQPDEHRGVSGAVWLADVRRALATPTPDDRDREVERIAAVIEAEYERGDTTQGSTGLARAIVAGLRASGGKK